MSKDLSFPVMVSLLLAGLCVTAAAQSPEDLRALHVRQIDAMNAHDMDLWLSYCTDDFLFEYVALTPPLNRAETKAFFQMTYDAYPDFHVTPRSVKASDHIVVDEKVVTGTHQGTWIGIPATGNSIAVPVLDVYEFAGDKLQRVSRYLDLVTWMIQLGVMPAPVSAPLIPTVDVPDPEPTGLRPLEAYAEEMARWHSRDLAEWAKMIHVDADCFVGPIGMAMDRAAYIASQELYLLAFPDREQENLLLTDMGDGWLLAEIVFLTNTNNGPYFGFTATGRSSRVFAGQLTHIDEEGLVTYQHTYFDNLSILVQLGLAQPLAVTAVRARTWGALKEERLRP